MFALIPVSLTMLVLRPEWTRPNLPLHAARSARGWGSATLLFAAVAHIPLSDTTAIGFLNPVFAMILAIPLLGETVGRVRWLAAGIAMMGALILLRPTAASFQPAALLALGAACIMGFELNLMKMLVSDERPVQILLINNTFGFIFASVAVISVWQMPTPAQWPLLAVVGVSVVAAQVCFLLALARAEASFIAPFSYATLVFATLFDFAVFNSVPNAVSLLGMAVIVSGALMQAMQERNADRGINHQSNST